MLSRSTYSGVILFDVPGLIPPRRAPLDCCPAVLAVPPAQRNNWCSMPPNMRPLVRHLQR